LKRNFVQQGAQNGDEEAGVADTHALEDDDDDEKKSPIEEGPDTADIRSIMKDEADFTEENHSPQTNT
jgi:hypothetical protein